LFGELMHEHWENKKRPFRGMSNPQIDAWYELGMKNWRSRRKNWSWQAAAVLDVLCCRQEQAAPLDGQSRVGELRFRFDFEGSKIVLS